MQGDDPEMLKAIERKLGALVRCVVKKAEADPAFAEQLQEVLLSDSLRAGIKEKRPPVGRPAFNPVDCLQALGRDGLQRELEGKPTSELTDVIRSHRIVKGKAAKALERPAVIDAILAYSERSLNQGGAFLRDRRGGEGSTSDASSDSSARSPDETEPPNTDPHPGKIDSRLSDDRAVEDK